MHVASAQILGAHLFAGGGLHQRRPAEEDGAVPPHNYAVVRQRGHVRPAGGAMPEHDGELGNTHLREDRLVSENAPGVVAVGEKFSLQGQKASGAVAQVDHGQAVFDGNIGCAHDLLD
ncbi:hypothetical protein D9M73_232950 [compost metagenome]